jgi:hypothetical protein
MVGFTARERSALGASFGERAPSKQHTSRDDFAPRPGGANTEIAPLIQQMTGGAVEKIDAVIAELHHRRDAIVEESLRMQHEIIAYAKLNKAAMDSSRVISGSLADLFKLADAPAMSELTSAVSDKEDHNVASERLDESNGGMD